MRPSISSRQPNQICYAECYQIAFYTCSKQLIAPRDGSHHSRFSTTAASHIFIRLVSSRWRLRNSLLVQSGYSSYSVVLSTAETMAIDIPPYLVPISPFGYGSGGRRLWLECRSSWAKGALPSCTQVDDECLPTFRPPPWRVFSRDELALNMAQFAAMVLYEWSKVTAIPTSNRSSSCEIKDVILILR